LPPAKAEEFMKRLGDDAADEWVFGARRQLPLPDLDWCWLFLGGRGAGKSHSMSGAVHTAVPAGMSQIRRWRRNAPLCVAARSSLECGRSQLLLSLRAKRVLFQDLCLTSTGAKSTPAKRGLLWASRVSRTAKRMFSSDDEAEGGVRLNLAMGDSVSRQQGPPPDPPARRTLMGAREPGKR